MDNLLSYWCIPINFLRFGGFGRGWLLLIIVANNNTYVPWWNVIAALLFGCFDKDLRLIQVPTLYLLLHGIA